MLETLPPRKNNRYNPNPLPHSQNVYASLNQIKAAGGKRQSTKEGMYDASLNMFLPSGIVDNAEEEKPQVNQLVPLPQKVVSPEVQKSLGLSKNQNDGYWDEAAQDDSDYEVYSPDMKEDRSSKKVIKYLDVDDEEDKVNQEVDQQQGERKNVQSAGKVKEFQGIEDLKREVIGQDNIEKINQKAFQDMMEERKENQRNMEILRKFTDQEEFKKLEQNIQDEEDDIEDIRKECLKIKMSDKFQSSRITDSQLQNMIEWHLKKEQVGESHEGKLKDEDRLGGKEKIKMTYENGSVQIKRELMESPVVAIQLSGGEKILTKMESPKEALQNQQVKVEEFNPEIKEKPRVLHQDNQAVEDVPRKDQYSTPGKVEPVTKAQVKVIGKTISQAKELEIQDVKLEIRAKADNEGGLEMQDSLQKKAKKGKKGKKGKKAINAGNMKKKGGCCGTSSCLIF